MPIPAFDDPGDETGVPADPHSVDDAGDFAPGVVLGGSYRLTRRLSRGGMGDIHLATHERLPGQFVVKVLSPDLVSDEDALVRFRQEAVVMANIRHPNVVQLVDFNYTLTGLPYLVMEYLPGKDLADILTTRPFLAATQVSSIVRQVACALDAAHKLGIVHRDLKPENIMVVPCEGQGDLIKVIDFGISKARRFNHVTSASMVMGTPEFMSPEQAQGRQEDVDSRSDQFALAGISYLLLTGRTPWGATAPIEILHRVVNSEPLPLTHDGSWPGIEAVLFRALSKAPHDRYPSTLAFWRALDQAMVSDGLLPSAGQGSSIHGPGHPARVDGTAAGAPSARSSVTVQRPEMLDSSTNDVVSAIVASPRLDSLDAPPSLLADGGQAAQFSLGSADVHAADDGHERSITTPMVRARRQPPRRNKQVLQAVVLLAVLACGAYVGMQEKPAVRARAGWNLVRTFAARAAERGLSEGQRLLSKNPEASKPAKALLSIGAE